MSISSLLPRHFRSARRLAFCGLCLWFFCPVSAKAAELFSGAAATSWRAAAQSVLRDQAEVKPTWGPWSIVGPFNQQNFETPFSPQNVAANPLHTPAFQGRKGKTLTWRPVEIVPGKGHDLRRLYPDFQRNGTLYLCCTLQAERRCVHAVAMRGQSGLAVWVNGTQLVDRGPGDGWLGGGWKPQEALLLPLKKGENRLLIRIDGFHKQAAWKFDFGSPKPAALRYSLSTMLTRTYPQAAAGLDWLRRDGLDLLELWPKQQRTEKFNNRLSRATLHAIARGRLWLTFLKAAGVTDNQLSESQRALETLGATLADNQDPSSTYFAAGGICRQLETSPHGQIIANWLQLDERTVTSPMDKSAERAVANALNRGEQLLRNFSGGSADARIGPRTEQQWRAELKDLHVRLKRKKPDEQSRRQLYVDAHSFTRALVFANPLLRFDGLMFYKRYSPRTMNFHRNHFPSARYQDGPARPGGGLFELSELRPDAKPRSLLRHRLGNGIVRGFDLSHDARRVVFGFWDADATHPVPKVRFEYDCYVTEGHSNLFELDLKTDSIRGLTDAPWHDVDPCYLPGGRIAFASERCGHNAQCDPIPWSEPMVNLYTIAATGGDVRRLTSHKDADNFARVLNDGRVFYTRWEYHERGGLLRTQSLWVSRPDGTQQNPLFKQHLDIPFSLEEGHAIPGSTKLVAVATGHHTNAAGAIVRINLDRGITATDAMQIVTPGVSAFEGGIAGVPPVTEGGVGGFGYYSSPWPLSDEFFLVAYSPGGFQTVEPNGDNAIRQDYAPAADMTRANGYGLYVIDVYGNRELIYRDPEMSCFSPIPLAPRPVPPTLRDVTDPSSDQATLLVSDVHLGLGVAEGTVKYLRINEGMPWPYTKKGASRYPREFDYTLKRTVGLVPVESDGSAYFTVPAGVGLYFQALDQNFLEVRRMRSLVSFQPGERRSCTGCHETKANAAPSAGILAARRTPSAPQPPVWGNSRPISFWCDVQPVLDQHCVICHSGLKPAGGIDLFAGLTGRAHPRAHSTSFDALSKYVPRSHKPFTNTKNQVQFDISQPYQFGSGKSKLVRLLLDGHENVHLDRADWLTLMTWIDTNGLYLGSFISVHDWGRWGYRPQPGDMQALHAIQTRRCAACHADDDLARPGWIDPRAPEKSLYLVAPLAAKVGGRGKCRPAVFKSTDDADYRALLAETIKIVTRMRKDPTPGMKELMADAPRTASAKSQ